MDIVQKIQILIEPSLDAMGYDIVQVKIGEAKRKTLTVMAERKDAVTMSIDDCIAISRMASTLLEVDDPISGAYNLEVCSPGTDRPLTKADDFKRFAGCEARIETMLPVDNRRRFRGELKGIKNEIITLHMPEGVVEIAFGNVRAAKLAPAEKNNAVRPGKRRKK